MAGESRSVSIDLDEETEQRLRDAAARKGVSVEQYCSEAVRKELNDESLAQKISLKGTMGSGKVILRGRLNVADSADALLALRDEISQGITTPADSVGLIQEARRRRGRRQEELGRS